MKEEEIFEKDDDIREELIQAATQLGRADLKKRFNKLDQPVIRKPLKLWWAVAAIGAILIASILFLKPTSPEALYASTYTKFKNNVVSITRGNSDEKELKMAMIAYEKGEFSKALPTLKIVSRSNPDVKIYLGIIAMENADFQKASQILTPLSKDNNYRFRDESSWYLALAYLKLDKIEEAKSVLEELKQGNSRYADKATKVLRKL